MSIPYTHDRQRVSEFRDGDMTNMPAPEFAIVKGYNLAQYEHICLEAGGEDGEAKREGFLRQRMAEIALDHHCTFVTNLQYQGSGSERVLLGAGFKRKRI